MTKKLTPQEAWEIGKKFFGEECTVHNWTGKGNVICCKKLGGDGYIAFYPDIDWPDGVTQWPQKELEPVYETPVIQQDWGKECEFSDDQEEWVRETLCGYCETLNYCWVSSGRAGWKHCRIRRDPEQAETPALDPIKDVVYPEQDLQNVGTSEQHPAESLVSQFIRLRYPYQEHDHVLKILDDVLIKDMEAWKQLLQHPADREPTDDEVERACRLYYSGFSLPSGMLVVRGVLKAWQQVWREAK